MDMNERAARNKKISHAVMIIILLLACVLYLSFCVGRDQCIQG